VSHLSMQAGLNATINKGKRAIFIQFVAIEAPFC